MALDHAVQSHHDPAVYPSHAEWADRKKATPVRIQWDPERSLRLGPLEHRSIQIGLGGEAARRYVDDWTIGVADVTDLAHEIHTLVTAGDLTTAADHLPAERPYPLPGDLRAVVGAT